MAEHKSINEQAAYKAHVKYFDDHPEWAALALYPINQWGTGKITLAHAVALALTDAYERGVANAYPEVPRAAPAFVRRPRPEIIPIEAAAQLVGVGLVRRRRL